MKIHEYQAKEILRSYGVPTPRGEVAFTPDEAKEAAERLGGRVVVKAQIHAGGRGKGGGVKLGDGPTEARKLADQILGMTLVTHQTGPEGRLVKRVLVEETLPIAREIYLGMTLDRATGKSIFMASSEGGMEIEEVAAKDPELILKETVEPAVGLAGYQARRLAFKMGIKGDAFNAAVKAMQALAKAYAATDATMLEINPFVITDDGRAVALDAKMDIDDNALYRHADYVKLRDLEEEDPLETDAIDHGLNYIKLDGNVGCMVNGAGLAMATMDIIQYAGGSPANFLDVGGGANADQIKNGFRIILSDPNVKAIMINIFGGILRVDVLAEGVIAAAKELDIKVPIVLRLEGTKVEEGRRLLKESGLAFIVAADMKEAAEKAVAAASA
ncbi:MAG: ADP-forming succinate--CoA ligase subunit beta [Acidobacteria bacterium]|nr:ADP-forming succinate--CoA ligase subunit beta [Acidobacteriota bacterium]MDA1234376.1 ADP-forming succinate--CoA ligase subunit beta [Acidobacteriota bacterium]